MANLILMSLRSLLTGFRNRAAMQAVIIALRQLIVLQRTQKTKRLILGPSDRCLWVWLSRLWLRWRSALIIVKPETDHRLASSGIPVVLDLEDSSRAGPDVLLFRNVTAHPTAGWTAQPSHFMAINFRCHAPIASLASRLSRPAPGLSDEPFGFHCQPATLIIGKTHAAVGDLLPQHTIFLHQIFDDLLLPLIHTTGDRYDEKGKWIQTRLHSGRLPRARNALSSSKPRQSSFWMVRHRPTSTVFELAYFLSSN